MIFALVMELVVTPIVCLWQMRVAKLYAETPPLAAPLTPPATNPEVPA
jgi:hypothetical protein